MPADYPSSDAIHSDLIFLSETQDNLNEFAQDPFSHLHSQEKLIMVKTGLDVAVAFALTIAAGLSTCIGALTVFNRKLAKLASKSVLASSLGLSAGVML